MQNLQADFHDSWEIYVDYKLDELGLIYSEGPYVNNTSFSYKELLHTLR